MANSVVIFLIQVIFLVGPSQSVAINAQAQSQSKNQTISESDQELESLTVTELLKKIQGSDLKNVQRLLKIVEKSEYFKKAHVIQLIFLVHAQSDYQTELLLIDFIAKKISELYYNTKADQNELLIIKNLVKTLNARHPYRQTLFDILHSKNLLTPQDIELVALFLPPLKHKSSRQKLDILYPLLSAGFQHAKPETQELILQKISASNLASFSKSILLFNVGDRNIYHIKNLIRLFADEHSKYLKSLDPKSDFVYKPHPSVNTGDYDEVLSEINKLLFTQTVAGSRLRSYVAQIRKHFKHGLTNGSDSEGIDDKYRLEFINLFDNGNFRLYSPNVENKCDYVFAKRFF